MTTVTLPAAQPPQESPDGADSLPRPGRYAVAPGRSLVELGAYYGPLLTYRRRVALAGASLLVPGPSEQPVFRFEFSGIGSGPRAVLTSEAVELLDSGRRLQLTGDLDVRGVAFPVLLRLRVVERAEDRLLVVGTARLPYRLLRRATGFRLPWRRPATRLRLLVAGEFT